MFYVFNPPPDPPLSCERNPTTPPGVGVGEFARLVPKGPAEVGGGGAPLEGNAGVSERKGDSEVGRPEAAGATKQPQKQQQLQQQQQLLEDLVPTAGNKSLPGTGVPFVVDSDETTESLGGRGKCAGAGSGGRVGGAGRALSVFEVKALQKARARQRDRMEAGEPQVHNKERGEGRRKSPATRGGAGFASQNADFLRFGHSLALV